ncbi:Flagellar protein FlaG [hydrothermal vent metagenome]|uniref:Flagellar protein FlaG n=1 Tax=hydrothermal vent metagenome TaxID=652676 RepID=A0A3B0XS44_9ZZZZ
MSNDITTNQVLKNASASSTASKTTEADTQQSRQNTAVDGGKTLPAQAQDEPISRVELETAVANLNERVQQVQRDLLFSVDDSSGRTVVRVVNSETEEVVRQIPTEEVLRISRNIQDQLDDGSGLIFETSA